MSAADADLDCVVALVLALVHFEATEAAVAQDHGSKLDRALARHAHYVAALRLARQLQAAVAGALQ